LVYPFALKLNFLICLKISKNRLTERNELEEKFIF
jgi:hypothetical protein